MARYRYTDPAGSRPHTLLKTMRQSVDSAAREKQDKALLDAAMDSLQGRYRSISECSISDPKVVGRYGGDHPPGALRRMKFDALAVITVLMSVHAKSLQNAVECSEAGSAAAWSRDLARLDQAFNLLKQVDLQ